ncbi:FAD dependent oxidoreductase [Fusarium pseudoanthophilum]|uniref:FAD dependent oxidoreductase n=1 Tax=Fusarium pseudoanthophilum TaxID=48495 RepID=A0A8H5P6T6_9HYPO|nr:FAD dependent oxidoreductase [Fusarium pseudoanthophilum]
MEDNNAIVIVGAGCIGLCTAYQLSKSFGNQGRKPSIIVVEAGDRPFAAASSACTGCFHYHFPGPLGEILTPLGQYSFDLWAQEAQNADFRVATGYRENSSYGICQGDGNGLDELPDWINKESSWDVDTQILGHNTATVQLLLACGPWTPTVYERLFPSAPVHLQRTTNAGDWIIFKNPCLTIPQSTAFVSFEPLIREKFEFAGRNDGTIWVCGRRNFDATLPSPGQSDEPDKDLIHGLSGYARKWLYLNCTCHKGDCDDVQILNKGRAFRPATKTGLPAMSEIKSSDITPKHASLPTGIYVCWGHGSWGLTLGMGSGRVMSQLMRGEDPDIDQSPFSLEQGTILAGAPSTELLDNQGL